MAIEASVSGSGLDLARVRGAFPALASGFTFLDNAGGSQILGRVVDRIADYLRTTNVQLGATYEVSRAAGARVAEAVSAFARLINASGPDEIVVGPSSTQLLANLAVAMADQVQAGDEIVVSRAEHESNVGPWLRLAEAKGARIRWWPIDRESHRLEVRDLTPLLGARTKIVAFTHVSNLVGSIHDVAEITKLAHAHGAQVVVDGVAYAPHRAIDVRAWDVDYYVFSAYKVYGPHLGVLYGKRARLAALAGINHFFITATPAKLQPGGVNFELAHGFAGVLDYLDELGGVAAAFDAFAAHEEALARPLLGFLAEQEGVRVLGEPSADRRLRVPTVSFTAPAMTPEAIVRRVDEHRIGIRYGDFYARRLVEDLGLAATGGVVRVSMVHYNTVEQIERLVDVLATILEVPRTSASRSRPR